MESFYRWIAWKLPRGLVYWSTVRLVAFATSSQWGATIVPELTAMDALGRWKVSPSELRG